MLHKSTAVTPRLVTIDQAAQMLALSTKTVRRFIWTGELPAIRISARLRIDMRDLERFIQQRRESVAS